MLKSLRLFMLTAAVGAVAFAAMPLEGQQPDASTAITAPTGTASMPSHCGLPWTSPVTDASLASNEPIAPLLEGLGSLHYKVTTSAPRAQTFFDQGLRLIYAFNHAEAVRAFKEAQRLDPMCAMCYWGESYALGPNINDPLPPERELEAYKALQKALEHKAHASPVEQAMIDALASRYVADPAKADRRALDTAYMNAMAKVEAQYPQDSEVGTIHVASIMETRPWEYWQPDGKPNPGIAVAVKKLESLLAAFPDHPGAHHYYIHIVEATPTPDRGVPSADRLESLMPGAGHLVHMPAHIYVRVGRYADASASNERAILADEEYIAQCQAQGIYPIGYYPHNIHFLWSASTMEGRSKVAIESARKVAAKMPIDFLKEFVAGQDFVATPYYALVRFGKWDEMLTEGAPASDLVFVKAMWHYGRAMAFTAKTQLDRARTEREALEALESHKQLQGQELAGTSLVSILQLAGHVIEGEMAAKDGRIDEAVTHLRTAVEMQDKQRYNEPPTWNYPVRQSLGAVLAEAGRHAEAEAVYRKDLEQYRENGWSLYGLAQALRAQQKVAEADAIHARFERAWSRADVTITASRF
jgi:tetratricopeptide (TPR) repeat protein